MASTLTKEQFTKKANEIHNSKYSYEKTIYVNMRKPITIICKKHGEFKQSPMNHLKTEGCPKCGYEGRHKKKDVPPEEPKKTSDSYRCEYNDDEAKKYSIIMRKKYKDQLNQLIHLNLIVNLKIVHQKHRLQFKALFH